MRVFYGRAVVDAQLREVHPSLRETSTGNRAGHSLRKHLPSALSSTRQLESSPCASSGALRALSVGAHLSEVKA